MDCKKWGCPHCAKQNNKRLKQRFRKSEANKWNQITHLSLTCSDTDANIDEEFDIFMKKLRKVRPHIRYLKVKEFQHHRMKYHGGIWRHLHVVLNQRISKYELIEYWNTARKTPFNMIEATYPHSFSGGSYLMKYLTKPEDQDLFNFGEKRYGSSRGVLPMAVRKGSADLQIWERVSLSAARIRIQEYNNILPTMHCTKNDLELMKRWYPEYDWQVIP